MADVEIPLSGDPRVDAALISIKGRFKDLEEAVIVQAFLEKKMGERVKEHAQVIADHDISMHESDKRLDRMEVLMEEMNGKVHFLLNREMQREGGPEAH
jgi:hypothetical protein